MYLSQILINFRAHIQHEDAKSIMEMLQDAHETAKNAVAEGDGTLKKANYTFHTLAGFQSQVQESSEKATAALDLVPEIKTKIVSAQELVEKAEHVRKNRIFHIYNLKISIKSYFQHLFYFYIHYNLTSY